MRIFITGGSGFVGSHLVPKLLNRGHKLLLLQKKLGKGKERNLAILTGDLRNIKSWSGKLKKFNPDAIIHLAWEGLGISTDYGAAMSLKNLINSLNLISFAGEIGCRKFLSVGSSWEYGAETGRLNESVLLMPPSHVPAFVIAKRAIQALGEQIALENKMQFL